MLEEYEKDLIMVMIQTEDIKEFKKYINPMAKHNQALRDNSGAVLLSNLERILGIPIIYHQVYNIQFPLAVHQGQDVYICNLPYIKCLLFHRHDNEKQILTETRKR